MVLAPMTRGRATVDGVVGDHHKDYYEQQANGGLVISEATQFSPDSVGWLCAPGIWNDKQVEAWKKVPDAVKSRV